ncbi:hypothetical protein BDB01DRAFT_831971 [Pilobolus umbonatus]|nr:hypothetical protein BDB01DRAFT_831971 [Pilobolus umbonatus]
MTHIKAVPFNEKEYWTSRFEKESHFEWLLNWEDIKEHIIAYLSKEAPILHLGCGNSTLAFDMWNSDYKYIVNVDYADNVIETMKQVTLQKQNEFHNDYSGILWYVGDCLHSLSSYLPMDQYPVIIDKSLTDAIACGDDDQQTTIRRLSNEVLSVTQLGGVWISITFSSERHYVWNDHADYKWELTESVPVPVNQNENNPYAPTIYYHIHILKKVHV